MVVVGGFESALSVGDRNLAVFERMPELIAEHREQDFICQVSLGRLPVDIEKRRIRRTRSVLEHVKPPLVGTVRDAHVVGDGVDNHAHAVLPDSAGKLAKSVLATELRIEPSVIHHVIAMRAARPGLRNWRDVTVADAEPVEILNYSSRVDEREFAIELESIRSRGNARANWQENFNLCPSRRRRPRSDRHPARSLPRSQLEG